MFYQEWTLSSYPTKPTREVSIRRKLWSLQSAQWQKHSGPEILAQAPFHMGSKRQSCIPSAQMHRAVLPKHNVEAYYMLLDGKQAEGSLTGEEGYVSWGDTLLPAASWTGLITSHVSSWTHKIPEKESYMYVVFFPVHISQSCSPKAVLYPAYFALLLALARLHTLSPTHGPERPHSLQMPYIIKTHILNLII
jgi:hypothetical protein